MSVCVKCISKKRDYSCKMHMSKRLGENIHKNMNRNNLWIVVMWKILFSSIYSPAYLKFSKKKADVIFVHRINNKYKRKRQIDF